MKNSQRIWIMYAIMFSLKILTVNELNTESHFIVQTVKLNQNIYSKGMWI